MQSSLLVVLFPLHIFHWLVNSHSHWLKSQYSHWLNVLYLSLSIGQYSLVGKVCLGVSSWFLCINRLCESCIFSQNQSKKLEHNLKYYYWNKLLQQRGIFVCFSQVARTRGQQEITLCYTIYLHWCHRSFATETDNAIFKWNLRKTEQKQDYLQHFCGWTVWNHYLQHFSISKLCSDQFCCISRRPYKLYKIDINWINLAK